MSATEDVDSLTALRIAADVLAPKEPAEAVPGAAFIQLKRSNVVRKTHAQQPPTLELILGPMFSGKTTTLLVRLQRQGFAGYQPMMVRYKKDTRYSDSRLSTHTRVQCEAFSAGECLMEDVAGSAEFESAEVVGLDEGQFYADLPEFCKFALSRGKSVVVAALSSTFDQALFGRTHELLPIADDVTLIRAICQWCGSEASFTARMSSSLELVDIGAESKYAAACRTCHAAQREQIGHATDPASADDS